MSGEVKVTAAIQVEKSSFKFPKVGGVQLDFDLAGDGGGNPGLVEIGTSEEAIALGDITTPGWLWAKNLDPTNYVEWGPYDGAAMELCGRMEAGEPILFRLAPASVTLYMKANTAPCKVQFYVFED